MMIRHIQQIQTGTETCRNPCSGSGYGYWDRPADQQLLVVCSLLMLLLLLLLVVVAVVLVLLVVLVVLVLPLANDRQQRLSRARIAAMKYVEEDL